MTTRSSWYAWLLIAFVIVSGLTAGYAFGQTTTPKNAMSGDLKVQGQLINSQSGTPVAGEIVVLKSTSIGAVTDLEGRFELTIPASRVTDTLSLRVQTVAYGDHEIPVIAQQDTNVVAITIGLDLQDMPIITFSNVICACPRPRNIGEIGLSIDVIKPRNADPTKRQLKPFEAYADREGVVWVMKY